MFRLISAPPVQGGGRQSIKTAATLHSYEHNGATPTKNRQKVEKNNAKNAAILRAKQPLWNDEKANNIQHFRKTEKR